MARDMTHADDHGAPLDVSRLTQTNQTVQCSVEKSEPAPSVDLLCPRIECQEKARNLCNFPPTFSTRIHSFLDLLYVNKNNNIFCSCSSRRR